jgi:hypothetical protein
MRLTYILPKKTLEKNKNFYYLVEIMWHTILPVLFIYLALEYHPIFYIFCLFSIFRIRPDETDL